MALLVDSQGRPVEGLRAAIDRILAEVSAETGVSLEAMRDSRIRFPEVCDARKRASIRLDSELRLHANRIARELRMKSHAAVLSHFGRLKRQKPKQEESNAHVQDHESRGSGAVGAVDQGDAGVD